MHDVMQVYLAVVAQAGEEPPSLMEMILTAEPIIQLVLLMLVGMSVTCWALIASKARVVRRAAQQSEDFQELFFLLVQVGPYSNRQLDSLAIECLVEFHHSEVNRNFLRAAETLYLFFDRFQHYFVLFGRRLLYPV